MFPAISIILFFALGLAFFVLSSKNDFGIDNLKNSGKSNDNDLFDKEIKEEKQEDETNKEVLETEVKDEIKEEKKEEETNKEELDEGEKTNQ